MIEPRYNTGKKVLIVAHPDDEILWFDVEEFNKIYIVFGDFGDSRGKSSGDMRRKAIEEHPLRYKIVHFNLKESNYWRDKSNILEYHKSYNDLCKLLKNIKADSVTTHNSNGEYGHSDHILVYNACMDTFNCPVNGKNPKLYREIKKVYSDNNCWTWY